MITNILAILLSFVSIVILASGAGLLGCILIGISIFFALMRPPTALQGGTSQPEKD